MKKDGDIFCNGHRVENPYLTLSYRHELVWVLGLIFKVFFVLSFEKFGINMDFLVSLSILPDSGSIFEVSLPVKSLNCSSSKSLGLI